MRTACCVALLAVWAGAGCVTLPSFWGEKKPELPAPVVQPAKPVRPVTAEQINENNAAEKAKLLLEEMERDAQLKR